MAVSLGKSLAYPTSDPEFAKKFAIGALMLGPGACLVIPPLFTWGQIVQVMKQSLDGKEEWPLPAWKDWGGLIVKGLVAVVIFVACFLPFSIVAAVSYIPADRGGVGALVGMPLKAGALVLLLAALTLAPMMLARYVRKNSLLAAFNPRGLITDLKRCSNDYSVLVIMEVIALAVIGAVSWVIPFIGGLVGLVMGYYWNLVVAHWMGRIYRAYEHGEIIDHEAQLLPPSEDEHH